MTSKRGQVVVAVSCLAALTSGVLAGLAAFNGTAEAVVKSAGALSNFAVDVSPSQAQSGCGTTDCSIYFTATDNSGQEARIDVYVAHQGPNGWVYDAAEVAVQGSRPAGSTVSGVTIVSNPSGTATPQTTTYCMTLFAEQSPDVLGPSNTQCVTVQWPSANQNATMQVSATQTVDWYQIVAGHCPSGDVCSSPPASSSPNPSATPSSAPSSQPSPSPSPVPSRNSCSPVRGSVGKRLLAALKCTVAETEYEARCAGAIVWGFTNPFKKIAAARKTAKGLIDLRSVSKGEKPLARLFNDLSAAKYSRHAPKGFRNFDQVWKKIDDAHDAWDVVKLLPSLAHALPAGDYATIAKDVSEIAGLHSCITALELAVA